MFLKHLFYPLAKAYTTTLFVVPRSSPRDSKVSDKIRILDNTWIRANPQEVLQQMRTNKLLERLLHRGRVTGASTHNTRLLVLMQSRNGKKQESRWLTVRIAPDVWKWNRVQLALIPTWMVQLSQCNFLPWNTIFLQCCVSNSARMPLDTFVRSSVLFYST